MDTEKGKSFNEYSPRYMCCCGSIHARTGTLIIAILAAIGLIVNFIINMATRTNNTHLASSIGSLVIGGAAIACVFYALYVQRAAFLIPYMILQILGVLVFVGLIVLCIFALAGSPFPQSLIKESMGGNNAGIDFEVYTAILIGVFVIDILLTLWFFWVIYKCLVFFRDRAHFAISSANNPGYSIHVSPITYKRPV